MKQLFLGVVIIAIIVAANYLYLSEEQEITAAQPEAGERDNDTTGSAAGSGEPEVRHPISEIRVDARPRDLPVVSGPVSQDTAPQETASVSPEPAAPAAPAEPPLPELEESDEPLRDALSGLIEPQRLNELFIFSSIIRHFVVTIDNMTRPKLPQQFRFTQHVPGTFAAQRTEEEITQEEEEFILDRKNYIRYSGFVSLANSLDLPLLVSLYTRYYPLFQRAYEDLGYPDRYFNDRLVEVIDHVLEAPVIREPILLVRPSVFYEFADPELEALSAGQKIMVRIGPENAAIVKQRLRELRRLLTNA